MACTPRSQLYDCERRDSTNIEVFSVAPGTISEVTSTGLADGQTIPILVKDETGEYVPYLVDGEQLVLSENNPSVVIEEEGMYKLDTSAIECPEGGITVTAQPYASEVSTSVTGCYTDAEGNSTPVEIIRYSDGTTPVVYNLGTGERIANPIGEFSQNCCDCDGGDVNPIQVISETEQLGCVVDTEGNVTGRAFFVPTFDTEGNVTATRMIMVALDGTVTDPYTGSWEECSGAGEISDVELNFLCVVNNDTGVVIQQVIQEIVYDSAGERLTTRFVDRVSGTPVALPGGSTISVCPEENTCVSCQSLILCDMVPNPNEADGIPWEVVDVVPDETDPTHVLHYHLSPADNPSMVGIVTLTTSTTLNGNGCSFPGVDYAISNPSTRTMTLDAVAQQMDSLQVNLVDFDSFEPTRINAATPLPRLGGTAYWDGPPDHATTIRPTENDGTGILYWDNPPAEIIYTVGNTGGGNSCSNLEFFALTLSLMPRSFMRTICRNCNGEIVSVTDTELDGVTPYTPVGDVTG